MIVHIINAVSVGFWVLLSAGIVARAVTVALRRGRGELRRTVARPLADSAAVHSAFHGWPPAARQLPDEGPVAGRNDRSQPLTVPASPDEH